MKKALFIFIGLAIFTSCSKETANPKKDTKPSIIGKWNAIKAVYIDSSQNYYDKDTIYYLPGSYANFSKNGKLYSKMSNNNGDFEYDTLSYQMDGLTIYLSYSGDSLNAPHTDTATIEILTDTSMVLYTIQHYTVNNGLPVITRDWGYLKR